jgi:lysophospholipase L1-like esterase
MLDATSPTAATPTDSKHSRRRHSHGLVYAALLLGILGGCGGGGGGGDASLVANPDTYPTGTGQLSLSVSSPGVLGNDTGSSITAELVSGPSSAQSFTLNSNGSFTYVHSSTSAATTDSFTYRAKNGTASSPPATVTINIVPPIAAADTYIVASSGSISPAAPGILSNDTGAGMTAVIGTGPQHATSFALNADGSFTYVHDGSATPDSFTYRAKVGALYSNTVTVTININQPPVATNGCYTIQNDTPPTVTSLQVDLTQRVSDPNGNGTITSYVIESLPASGSITGCSATPCPLSNGIVTYVPNSNSTGRRGMDRFTFHAVDSGGLPSPTRTAWILNNGKVRIMPLGDSITAGIWTNDTPASGPTGNRAGYRELLYPGLVNTGYPVDFVGQYSDGGGTGLADTDHEGLPGLTACDLGGSPGGCPAKVNQDAIERLDISPADVILLHIGTNNFSPSSFAVESVLDRVDTWENTNHPVWVFVAKIIDDAGATNGDLDVQTFNTNVTNMVNARTTDKLRLVDQYSVVDQSIDDIDPYTLGNMYDDLHPNPSGYTNMANRWLTSLVNSGVLPSCQ